MPAKECRILVSRNYKLPDYTIGKMYINETYFCDTLEDTDRGLNDKMSEEEILKKKIPGSTAIPTGEYKVLMDRVSPKYSTRDAYQFCEGKVPFLDKVPGFAGILIHIGNYPKDTEGCILVGKNTATGAVMNSTETFKRLYDTLKEFDEISIVIS
jgi:hypothetical protein